MLGDEKSLLQAKYDGEVNLLFFDGNKSSLMSLKKLKKRRPLLLIK